MLAELAVEELAGPDTACFVLEVFLRLVLRLRSCSR